MEIRPVQRAYYTYMFGFWIGYACAKVLDINTGMGFFGMLLIFFAAWMIWKTSIWPWPGPTTWKVSGDNDGEKED